MIEALLLLKARKARKTTAGPLIPGGVAGPAERGVGVRLFTEDNLIWK